MDGFQHGITALVALACILAVGVIGVVLWPFITLILVFFGSFL